MLYALKSVLRMCRATALAPAIGLFFLCIGCSFSSGKSLPENAVVSDSVDAFAWLASTWRGSIHLHHKMIYFDVLLEASVDSSDFSVAYTRQGQSKACQVELRPERIGKSLKGVFFSQRLTSRGCLRSGEKDDFGMVQLIRPSESSMGDSKASIHLYSEATGRHQAAGSIQKVNKP